MLENQITLVRGKVKYKIYLVLFFIGAFPTYTFSILNLVGFPRFPEVRAGVIDKATLISSPTLTSQLSPVITLTMRSDGTIIREAGVKYIEIHDALATGTSAVVVAHDLFISSKA